MNSDPKAVREAGRHHEAQRFRALCTKWFSAWVVGFAARRLRESPRGFGSMMRLRRGARAVTLALWLSLLVGRLRLDLPPVGRMARPYATPSQVHTPIDLNQVDGLHLTGF